VNEQLKNDLFDEIHNFKKKNLKHIPNPESPDKTKKNVKSGTGNPSKNSLLNQILERGKFISIYINYNHVVFLISLKIFFE
jgi:hypothetical protein